MLDLYGMGSPNVEKILIMLEETATPYRVHRVDIFKGEQFLPAFKGMNPNGKVPVIVDSEGPDGQPHTIFESGAILLYLSEKGAGKFLPTAFGPRYEVLQWLMLQVATVGPMLGQLNHFQFFNADNGYAMTRYRNEARRIYDLLDARLRDHPYLCGADYSLADIATYPWVSSYHPRHLMNWDDRPALNEWQKRIGERPAVVRAAQAMLTFKPADEQAFGAATKPELDRLFNRAATA